MTERNPLIIPAPEVKRSGCPHCGAYDFSGRKVGGVLLRTCRKCGGQWAGGLPQEPQDPRIPLPTESYVPPVQFEANPNPKNPDPVEIRRRVDPTPAFRKGAPLPSGDE